MSYGPSVLERLDIFPVENKGAPVAIYHHGGAWIRSSKDQCSYAAPGLVAAGINVLVLDFALAPAVSLDEIVRQNRAAIAWTWHNAENYGWDRNQIHCIGHSSGGHICGMMQVTDWEKNYGLPVNVVKSAAACSGMYDLEPVRFSHRNTYLDLTEKANRSASRASEASSGSSRATIRASSSTFSSPLSSRSRPSTTRAVSSARRRTDSSGYCWDCSIRFFGTWSVDRSFFWFFSKF